MRDFPLLPRVFLEGPAGSGKTTYAVKHLESLLSRGISANGVLVLVPQRALGQTYQLAMHEDLRGYNGDLTMVTLSGLARRNVERFWPLVARSAGYDPHTEPVFLTIETAQYHMMRFTRPAIGEGLFDSVSLTPPRIAAQLLDNMAKAAIAGFPFSEVESRLATAWGDRHSSRLQVYRASQAICDAYRKHCKENCLLDFAVQLELFIQHLVPHKTFRSYFAQQYQHLIADNIEEAGPLVHDFIADWWGHWQSALLIYDTDGGFRTFLGADPDNAVGLSSLCDQRIVMDQPLVNEPQVLALEQEVRRGLSPVYMDYPAPEAQPLDALHFEYQTYYPQMIDWVTCQIVELVGKGIPKHEIVVLVPFLSDSLRFSLQSRLDRAGINSRSLRPSRAIRDEPAARAMLTLLSLAHPQWGFPAPPKSDIADMLGQVIEGMDPVRARLLADIVYKPNFGGTLSSFEQIQPSARDRITYVAGERYERLRVWLEEAQTATAGNTMPPDHFLSRLFGEVLSQQGFGFHTNLDGGRVTAQIIESIRKFRQVLYPISEDQDWNLVGAEYLQLVNEGVLSALYMHGWRQGNDDAVFIAPAYTYLMQNRIVDYQFWLDVGSTSWWERIEQPLTHPYVLMRHYVSKQPWTEQDEVDAQQTLLHRITIGLLRRCRKGIYLGISDLGEQGFEQRGPLLYVFQQILQRFGEERIDGN